MACTCGHTSLLLSPRPSEAKANFSLEGCWLLGGPSGGWGLPVWHAPHLCRGRLALLLLPVSGSRTRIFREASRAATGGEGVPCSPSLFLLIALFAETVMLCGPGWLHPWAPGILLPHLLERLGPQVLSCFSP